jgi:hypothetical protein
MLQNVYGESGWYDGNVEIVAVAEIYEVCVSIYVASEGNMTQPPSAVVGQVVKEMSLLFGDKLDNGHCDALLSFEGKERQYIFLTQLASFKQTFPKKFHRDRSSVLFFYQV